MSENFDLLGDPIPPGWGGRGRPQHIPTKEKRNKVMMLLALGRNNVRIAQALGISEPTLRKHYFRELKVRDEARERVDANLAMTLWNQAMKGNVGAIKEFRKLMDRNDVLEGQRNFYGRTDDAEVRSPRLGKKEERALAAQTAGQDSDWGDDLVVPAQALN